MIRAARRTQRGACWRNANGNLYAPYSYFDDSNRKLNQNWIDNDWNDNWSFVGFRDSSA